jgi:hypothetical protein
MKSQTLLGSNFFNFKPLDDQRIVSSWLWVYGAVTVIITLAVLLTWFFLSRSKAKEMERKLGLLARSTLRNTQPDQNEIAGFWTTRNASAIWCERVIRAEDKGARSASNLARTISTVSAGESNCQSGCAGCGSGCSTGCSAGCSAGCGAD